MPEPQVPSWMHRRILCELPHAFNRAANLDLDINRVPRHPPIMPHWATES